MATRKLDALTRTGIFWRSMNGAITGSSATKISTVKKAKKKTIARTRGAITRGSDHCDINQELNICQRELMQGHTGRLSLYRVLRNIKSEPTEMRSVRLPK